MKKKIIIGFIIAAIIAVLIYFVLKAKNATATNDNSSPSITPPSIKSSNSTGVNYTQPATTQTSTAFDPSTGAIPTNYQQAQAVMLYPGSTVDQMNAANTILNQQEAQTDYGINY
jgi:hypothetical protein